MKWFSKKQRSDKNAPYKALPEHAEGTELDDLSTGGLSLLSHSQQTNEYDSYETATSPSPSPSALLGLSSSTQTPSRPGSSSSSSSSESDTMLLSKNEDTVKMSRFQMAKQRVDLLTEKARESLQQILDRGDKVDDLNERAHNLLKESFQFKKVTRTLKKRMWMRNIKMILAVLAASAVLLALLLLYLIPKLSKHVAEGIHHTKEWMKRRKDDIKRTYSSNSTETNETHTNREVTTSQNGTTVVLVVVVINSTTIPPSDRTSETFLTTTKGNTTSSRPSEPMHNPLHSSHRKSPGGKKKNGAVLEEYHSEQNVTVIKPVMPHYPLKRRPPSRKVHSNSDLDDRTPEQIDIMRQEVERKLMHLRKQLDRKPYGGRYGWRSV